MLARNIRLLVTMLTILALVIVSMPSQATASHASSHCVPTEIHADATHQQDAPVNTHHIVKTLCCIGCPANALPNRLAWNLGTPSRIQLLQPDTMVGRLRAPPETPPPNV